MPACPKCGSPLATPLNCPACKSTFGRPLAFDEDPAPAPSKVLSQELNLDRRAGARPPPTPTPTAPKAQGAWLAPPGDSPRPKVPPPPAPARAVPPPLPRRPAAAAPAPSAPSAPQAPKAPLPPSFPAAAPQASRQPNAVGAAPEPRPAAAHAATPDWLAGPATHPPVPAPAARPAPAPASPAPAVPAGPVAPWAPAPALPDAAALAPAPVAAPQVAAKPRGAAAARPSASLGPARERTPEVEEIHAEPGGALAQLGAWLVDAIVLSALFALYLFAAQAIAGKIPPSDQTGLDWLIDRAIAWRVILMLGAGLLAVLSFVYSSLFHALGGRTLGKRLFGLTLVDSTGQPPPLARSAVRSLLAFVSAGLLLMGFALMLFDRKGQALHDKLTGTFVVRLAEQ